MKKLIRLLLVVAALLALGLTTYAVSNRYEAYKVDQRAKQLDATNKTKLAVTEAQKAQEDQKAYFLSQLTALHAECKKGEAAYALLTAPAQKKMAAPVCPDVQQ